MDNKKFNIDDEYVLHICSGRWKKYTIYKPKLWTDAQGYFEAYSDDGRVWCFGSQSDLKPFESTSIECVANCLWLLNKEKRYIDRVCQWCAGSSEKATDFPQLPCDTVQELETRYEE